MNIYAERGHKVKCTNLTNGYDHDKEKAQKYLQIDKEYTIEKTDVYGWHTDVWLEELPNVSFNSVFFEDVIEEVTTPNDEKIIANLEPQTPEELAAQIIEYPNLWEKQSIADAVHRLISNHSENI